MGWVLLAAGGGDGVGGGGGGGGGWERYGGMMLQRLSRCKHVHLHKQDGEKQSCMQQLGFCKFCTCHVPIQ